MSKNSFKIKTALFQIQFVDHYHALARYIELAWRRGNIDLMEKALKNAIENNPRASMDAGYSYCKGIVEW